MAATSVPLFPELTSVLDNVTVLDFETTGLGATKGRVIEIAALKGSVRKVVSQFQTMVRLKGKVPAKTTEITGIKQEDVAQGLEERTAFLMLQELIGDSVVVMHNAPYDLSFLYNAYHRLKFPPVQHPFLDTLSVCRLRQPSPRSLPDMCRVYNIPLPRWHRALPDATATWHLLHRLYQESPVDPLLNKIVVNPKYGWPKWVPPMAEVILPPEPTL
ncbi:MAG: PolC-type DNA polymerase III [Rufibacter sp.]